MPASGKRKQVAIVGGGCAAMAAAWDLTSPENGDPCEVTIFQMGGRLGGKGASSRNTQRGYRNRIEEHGLHLWLGYYENAFRMIRTSFKALRAARRKSKKGRLDLPPEIRRHLDREPFDNWNWLSAFERASVVGLADDSAGGCVPWVARFPEYVHKSEVRATGIYHLPDGSMRPGVHVVAEAARAYPGQKPKIADGKACDDGEDVCLERPNVAFFLTHALRELQAFMDSFEERLEHLSLPTDQPMSLDADELLGRALDQMRPPETTDLETTPVNVPRVVQRIRLVFLVPAIEVLATVARIAEGPMPYQSGLVVTMLDRFIDEMRDSIEHIVQGDAAARRTWELIDLLAANIRGIVAAGLEGTDDFSSLDEWNYVDWLRMNRIGERTLNNPIIRGAHDLGFAYRDGNPRDPQIAAGQAISAGCRFFFMYKGALFWRMKAGMGDVVFAPMYLALRNRGVKFRFFHRLDEIVLDKSGAVSKLKFLRQVALKIQDKNAQTNYKPLISVNGLPGWRPSPDVAQFAFDAAMRAEYDRMAAEDEQSVNFESIWCKWPHGEKVTVSVGEGRDYDAVIVTVPVAALGRVSRQVAASTKAGKAWTAMLENLGTVATQSVQLWVKKTTRDLGWMHGQVSFSAFVHPFDTWADLSHLIAVEQPDGAARPARGVHYFCSVLPERQIPRPLRVAANQDRIVLDDGHPVAEAHDVVRANARYFLDEWVFELWPDAAYRYPTAFKWDEVLVDPEQGSGPDRLDGQHAVANVDPSERYTLSLPGTTKYRLRPDEAVLPRLFVAGDWTDCGLNIGCVEAAVMSGRLASSGITGYPDRRLIPGLCSRQDRVTEMQGGY